jgi:hypothetical protein
MIFVDLNTLQSKAKSQRSLYKPRQAARHPPITYTHITHHKMEDEMMSQSPRRPLSPKAQQRKSARSSDLTDYHRREVKYLNFKGIRKGLCTLNDFLKAHPQLYQPYNDCKVAFSRQVDQWNRRKSELAEEQIPPAHLAPLAHAFIRQLELQKLVDEDYPRLHHRRMSSNELSIDSVAFQQPPTRNQIEPTPPSEPPASKAKSAPAPKPKAITMEPKDSSIPTAKDFDYGTAKKYNQVFALDFESPQNNPPGVEAITIPDVVVKDPKKKKVTVTKGIVLHPMTSIENAEMVSGLHCICPDATGYTLFVPVQDYKRLENSDDFHEWIAANLECDDHEDNVTKKVIFHPLYLFL